MLSSRFPKEKTKESRNKTGTSKNRFFPNYRDEKVRRLGGGGETTVTTGKKDPPVGSYGYDLLAPLIALVRAWRVDRG